MKTCSTPSRTSTHRAVRTTVAGQSIAAGSSVMEDDARAADASPGLGRRSLRDDAA